MFLTLINIFRYYRHREVCQLDKTRKVINVEDCSFSLLKTYLSPQRGKVFKNMLKCLSVSEATQHIILSAWIFMYLFTVPGRAEESF